MRRVFSFIFFLLFKYYERGENTNTTAYESAIVALIVLIFLNVATLFSIFNLTDLILLSESEPGWLKYLKISIGVALPGYILLRFLFPKQYIMKLTYDERIITRGNIVLVGYVILSIIALFIFG